MSNFGGEPSENTNLRTQEFVFAPGAMNEYMTRRNRSVIRRSREAEIELKVFEKSYFM